MPFHSERRARGDLLAAGDSADAGFLTPERGDGLPL
jgi:hypothetical protein